MGFSRFARLWPRQGRGTQSYVDSITTHGVTGWIAYPPGMRIKPPAVRINGRIVGYLNLGGERPDATSVLGFPAFSAHAKIIRHMRDGDNTVQIEWASGEVLPNGKAVIPYDRDRIVRERRSGMFAAVVQKKLRWWQCDHVVRAVNKMVCGEPVDGVSEGLNRLVRRRFPDLLPVRNAISVGAGIGEKEMNAIDKGLAARFDLYEVSEQCVEIGRKIAKMRGLEERVSFHLANAFEAVQGAACYDMVFWNQALSRTFDARAAVAWSARVLRPGGLFVMDDYVGATRMQWPDVLLDLSSRFRAGLPTQYLANPLTPGEDLPVICARMDEDDVIAHDPSQCADSGNILPALREHFPNVEVILTGGGVYHCGLSDVLHNITEAGDIAQLDRALELDAQAVALGRTHYGVALGVKPAPRPVHQPPPSPLRNKEVARKRPLLGIAVLDDFFPHPISAFRFEEFLSYLEEMPETNVYSTGSSLGAIRERRSVREVILEFNASHPHFAGRVHRLSLEHFPDARGYYAIFLENIFRHLIEIELRGAPFAFTLYPGGGLALDQFDSDAKLARVLGSRYFRNVIVTQPIVRDYLLEKRLCREDQITPLFGGVLPRAAFELPGEKIRFGEGKDTLDFCFVANRYNSKGADKGYDLFVEVAHALLAHGVAARFHVVGPFDATVIDLGNNGSSFRFYGYQPTPFFRDFYRRMDAIISPNRPFVLAPGSFDGFPTGCSVEAGLQGVAVVCTDELHLNVDYCDGKDIVIVRPDLNDILAKLLPIIREPGRLADLGRSARIRMASVYDRNKQIGSRIQLLQSALG